MLYYFLVLVVNLGKQTVYYNIGVCILNSIVILFLLYSPHILPDKKTMNDVNTIWRLPSHGKGIINIKVKFKGSEIILMCRLQSKLQ